MFKILPRNFVEIKGPSLKNINESDTVLHRRDFTNVTEKDALVTNSTSEAIWILIIAFFFFLKATIQFGEEKYELVSMIYTGTGTRDDDCIAIGVRIPITK